MLTIQRQAHDYSCWHSAQKKQDICRDNITKQNVLDQNVPKPGVLPVISKELKAHLDCVLSNAHGYKHPYGLINYRSCCLSLTTKSILIE